VGFIDAITAVADPRALDDCDEWCAGLPLESVRVLDSAELDRLRETVNRQFARQQAASISIAVFFVGLYITTILFPTNIAFWMTVAAAVAIGSFVVWLFGDPDSWLRRYKNIQSDLDSGVVHCFQNCNSERALEMLPRSEIVYQANRVSPKKWHRSTIHAVAKTPQIASIAMDWLQPVQGSVGKFFCGKRSLSAAERQEISRWAEQVVQDKRRHALGYACWAAFLGWVSRFGSPDVFYAALAFTGYSGSRIVSELRTAAALKKDASTGKVVINRRATVTNGALKPVGTTAEFLPKAKLKWTEGGSPAAWRKLP
jgi:hypothetical protein